MHVLDVEVPFGVAHRGSCSLWPENTMVAFAEAVALGFEWLETDLHLTADGAIVCVHDPTLDRTTDRSGRVCEVSLADLAGIDAGHRHAIGSDHPHRGTGVVIPELAEVLASFPDVRCIVDLKQDGLEEPLWRLIEQHRLHDRLVVGSFSDGRLAHFRELSEGRVATSTGPVQSVIAWLGAMIGRAPHLADAVQLPTRVGPLRPITARTVRRYHAAGYQVHVWTINDPVEMRSLLEMGVDAIITDRPDILGPIIDEYRAGSR